MTKSSIMIDLDDPRTEKIAEVISNKTSKKILGVLAEREMSETDISRALNLAMNTVNYNVKKLEEAGLIEKVKGFLWSEKGKRIHKYKVVDRRIVISPRSMIRGIIPSVLITGIIALGIKIFVGVNSASNVADNGVSGGGAEIFAGELGVESAKVAAEPANYGGGALYRALANAPNSWAWFFIGALTALLILILWNVKNEKFLNTSKTESFLSINKSERRSKENDGK